MRLAGALLLVLLAALPVAALERSYAGEGVAFLRTSELPLPVYRWPGVSRIAEVPVSRLPRLQQVAAPPGEAAVAVHARRGEWLLVAYDEAGREGWVQETRGRYQTWERFLPGRTLRVLPGLSSAACVTRSGASDEEQAAGSLKAETRFVAGELREDWVSAAGGEVAGWFRWRDPNGKLTVRLQGESNR
ncbi:MAG TPA: SH3 domain-containing protein [Verrucomicrobiae bacterium]|nr:SH3 domain-containing protein [Verrucomicrobiae bacterium]